MNIIEVRFANGEVVIIEDKAECGAIGQMLSDQGFYNTVRLHVGMNATSRTPISILERSVLYIQPRA